MQRIFLAIAVSCGLVCTVTAQQPTHETGTLAQEQVQPPPNQVIAVYFHRTQRCPTCKRIGTLTQQAVTKKYAAELRTKSVEVRLIDFEDEKNSHLTNYYKIKSPTLILLDVKDGKVTRWKAMPKVWQLIGRPDMFEDYVQQGVKSYLSETPTPNEANR
ncbi:nitrophenyl compound nitroreductase subunit ArsF family protein [Rhodopirellula sallentina]|nr:nitrophenyl compound nitroreductase subunit ArsF family protein [Rhodopirellula sallentina]